MRHGCRHHYGHYGRARGASPAVILLGLGAFFLFLKVFSLGGALTLLALGGLFTALSVGTGRRGFLVPGGILLGLGVGTAAAHILERLTGGFGGAATVAGLGLGFWFIYAFDRARRPHSAAFAWARVPGTILLTVGAILGAFSTLGLALRLTGFALNFWPLLLLAGGLWLLFRSLRRRARGSQRRRDDAIGDDAADDPNAPVWPDLDRA